MYIYLVKNHDEYQVDECGRWGRYYTNHCHIIYGCRYRGVYRNTVNHHRY